MILLGFCVPKKCLKTKEFQYEMVRGARSAEPRDASAVDHAFFSRLARILDRNRAIAWARASSSKEAAIVFWTSSLLDVLGFLNTKLSSLLLTSALGG